MLGSSLVFDPGNPRKQQPIVHSGLLSAIFPGKHSRRCSYLSYSPKPEASAWLRVRATFFWEPLAFSMIHRMLAI